RRRRCRRRAWATGVSSSAANTIGSSCRPCSCTRAPWPSAPTGPPAALIGAGLLVAEGAGGAGLLDLLVAPTECVPPHLLGVLTDGRRLRGHGERLVDELDRGAEHVGTDDVGGQQLEPVLELRVVVERLR